MKKVYSNKFMVYFLSFGVFLFSIFSIICVFSLISNIMYGKKNVIIVYSILLFEFICFLSLFLFSLNRFGCKIIYNANEGIIIRKGFICGYEYQLKIHDITEIIIASVPWETTYYVFIDSINTKYDSGSKKSFIRIEKNENNLKFIKQFWDKPIKNN